jgi:hypothetical protein
VVYHLPVLPPELAGPPEGWAPKEGFSPSALARYAGADGCKRAWAWGALFGVWSLKKSIAALLGSLIHGSIEHYLGGGSVHDLNGPNGEIRLDARTWKEFEVMLERGWLTRERLAELAATAPKRALTGIAYLPVPGEPGIEIIETEQWIDIDTRKILGGVERIKINGKIDLRMRRYGIWYLYDHKSTGGDKKKKDPWGYCKTPEQLAEDPQAVFYALDLMLRHNLDALWLRWVYYLTDVKSHPLAKPVDVELRREQVFAAAYRWLCVAHEMRGLVRAAKAGGLSPYDVPANPKACDAFGGCTYHFSRGGPCFPEGELTLAAMTPDKTGEQPEKETDMSLSAHVANTKAALANGSNGQSPLIPPGTPFTPPEAHLPPAAAAPAALPALPAGWHYFNGAPRQDPQPGYMYDASGTQVIIPPPPAPVASDPAVAPDVQQAADREARGANPDGTKRKGRPPGAKNKAPKAEGESDDESFVDRILSVATGPTSSEAIRSLTVAQLNALRDVFEG